MEDLISRQAAIDILDEYSEKTLDTEKRAFENARRQMCELPSVQPEIIMCKDCKHFSDIWCNRHMCRTYWN